jgi:PAS domain S-box-containing protein
MKLVNSLRFKLVVFSLIIEVTALSLLIINADRLILNHLSSSINKQIESTKSNFQAALLPLLIERDYATLDSLLKDYTNSKDIIYILIKKDDTTISNSNWNKKEFIPIQSTKITSNENIYHTSVDITFANQVYGKVYFGFNTSFLHQASKELFSQSFIIAALEIILSILLLFSIGYFLTKHLSTLTEASEKIAQNQFDIDLNIKSKDEIGLLSRTFNKMATKIKTQLFTIEEQNQLKKAIFDNMAYNVLVFDRYGLITSYNKQAEKTFGYKASELINKEFITILHKKEDLEKKAKELSNIFQETIEPNFKVITYKTDKGLENQNYWQVITKENKELIIKLSITALRDKDNNIYGYIGVAEDKTEKYYLEKSLEEETHRIKTILENAGDFIHILDKDGNLYMYSSSFINSLGYTEQEAKSLNIKDWDKNFKFKDDFDALLKQPKTFESEHTRKDGTTFDVEIRTKGIILDGKYYLYAASRDITERNQIQEELRQKDILLQQQSRLSSMGEMLGNIAHQWRQPLSLISATATGYQLKSELGMKSTQEETLKDMKKINEAVQYLSKTIDDFRNFFRSNNKKEIFKLAKVIDDCENITSASFKNNHIILKKLIENTDLEYNGASSMLSQVILNIFSNAKDILVEKNIKNKIVTITLKKEQNITIIKIKDNAGGVPEEIIDKIFDPYFTTKHQSQGTGIGLYMSSQIIQKHFDGSLSVKNTKDENGFGAEFTIKI